MFDTLSVGKTYIKLVVPQCFFQFVRWQNSKRLIYGSLVCLSCDNFESFLFATVSDRDPKELQKGLVQITFTEESRHKLVRIEVGQLLLCKSCC